MRAGAGTVAGVVVNQGGERVVLSVFTDVRKEMELSPGQPSVPVGLTVYLGL